MSLFSKQEFICCMCGQKTERTCDGLFTDGVCSMRCHYEKEWRRVLSIMGKAYHPDPRQYTDDGYPKASR
jgi:hypothetical protein